MKIIRIFDDVLFAFHYEDKVSNEYERLMDLWTDVAFLKQFAENNAVSNVSEFIRSILQDAEQIQDFLKNLRVIGLLNYTFSRCRIPNITDCWDFKKAK